MPDSGVGAVAVGAVAVDVPEAEHLVAVLLEVIVGAREVDNQEEGGSRCSAVVREG
jgi:hypothetical protein